MPGMTTWTVAGVLAQAGASNTGSVLLAIGGLLVAVLVLAGVVVVMRRASRGREGGASAMVGEVDSMRDQGLLTREEYEAVRRAAVRRAQAEAAARAEAERAKRARAELGLDPATLAELGLNPGRGDGRAGLGAGQDGRTGRGATGAGPVPENGELRARPGFDLLGRPLPGAGGQAGRTGDGPDRGPSTPA